MAKTFKSIGYIDDSDVMNLTSSSSESDSEETSGSTTVAEELLQVQDSQDSIDRELDAMEQPPPEASVPVVAAAPPAQHRKSNNQCIYPGLFQIMVVRLTICYREDSKAASGRSS
jgi:hypothetical protein